MSGQTQTGTALQALAEKLRTDAIAIFGEGQSERDIIEWFYGSLLAAAPARPAVQSEEDYSTTSDRYRADLYDEVWQRARDMGYGNVTMALEDLAAFRANAPAQPTQQGEAVEVVGWRRLDRTYELTSYPSVCAIWHGVGYPVQALYTKPVASVPAGCKVVPVELLEQIAVELEHDNDRYFLGRELRALLASVEGGE